MGWREAFQQVRDERRKASHIREQGYPPQMQYLVMDGIPAGITSEAAREQYAEEKARRDPLELDPFS